jgi:hypothetical protein
MDWEASEAPQGHVTWFAGFPCDQLYADHDGAGGQADAYCFWGLNASDRLQSHRSCFGSQLSIYVLSIKRPASLLIANSSSGRRKFFPRQESTSFVVLGMMTAT